MEITLTKVNLAFVAFFVIFQATLVRSEKTVQCSGHEIKLSAKQMESMKACAEVIGIKTMEEMTPEKIPCFAKCYMEKGGLIDDQGKPHKENIMRDIEGSIPDKIKEAYKAEAEKCITDHGHHLSPNDQTCLSYNPMAMCFTKAFKSICQQ